MGACSDKSARAMAFTYMFIGSTLLSIFACMTIVACAQKITSESNHCMMFDADDRLAREVVRMTKKLTDRISIAFEVALFFFFVDVLFALCLYFLTNNWVRAEAKQAQVRQPPANGTEWNPELIYTNRGEYRVRCTDPYNEEQNNVADLQGSILAFVYIGLSVLFFLLYTWLRCWVVGQFSREALQRLAVRQKMLDAARAIERNSATPMTSPTNATMSQRLVNMG
jgi:hypothetical protein